MSFRFIILALFIISRQTFAQVNIGIEEHNVIYRGLPNPISVACGNKDSFFIKEKSETLEVKNENGRFYLNCLNVKEDSAFIVFGLQNSTLQRKFVFPVENIPEPKIRLGALDPSNNVSKSALMVQQSMVAVLENFVYDGVKYKVTGYRMKYFDYATLQIKTIDVDGSTLAPIKPALSKLNTGDRFEFSNIHILAPDNKTIKFSNILIEIN
jgi:hypothetical protein